MPDALSASRPDLVSASASASATAGLPNTARLRSGTAARLAGVPVATLRVWERRYGVVDAPKTATGQRVYTAHDVQRLRLLRQLTESGHGIGSIATLALAELQTLVLDAPPTPQPQAAPAGPAPLFNRVPRVWVVGRGAAAKLAGQGGFNVLAVFDDVAQALAQRAGQQAGLDPRTPAAEWQADVLLVQCASLQPDTPTQLQALVSAFKTPAVLVLYAFGAETLAEQLRATGARVQREPVRAADLARLVSSLAPAVPALAPGGANVQNNPPIPQRRFSDAALVALAEASSSVACECPRHLAEICMQLVGFEHYSADCGARSPADAALHAHLCALAGSARGLFEQALERVALEEGLLTPDGAR